MRKTYSLVLMAAALLFGTQAKADFAADWNYAVANGGTIVLDDDVDGVASQLVLASGKTVIIDLNGNDLDFGSQNLEIQHGALTITGEGKVSTSATSLLRVKGSTDPSAENYSKLIVEKDVVVECTGGYAVMVPHNSKAAYGVVIDIYGKVFGYYGGIYINGNVNKTGDNAPMITVKKDAVITSTGEEAAGIYAGGYGHFLIEGTVQGDNGIYVKGGKIILDGAAVIAVGSYSKPVANGNGFDGSGNALIFDTNSSYPGKIEFEAKNNPTVSAQDGYAIEELITKGSSSDMITMDVTSGSFDGSKGGITTSDDVKSKLQAGSLGDGITGGSFSNAAADMMGYLNASVSEAAEVVDGKVIVGKKDAEFIEREGLSVGKFGTICYESGSKNYAGATFFQIASIDDDMIELEEVAELFAGMPYIFEASAAKIMIEKQGEPKDYTLFAPYLVGSFNQALVPAGNYVISNNKAMLCGENCSIEAHRAYIDLSASAAPAPARVGGKRYMMSINNEATELEVAEAVKAGRPVFMHNGKLFIMKDKAMYHVLGAQMR